MRDIFHESYRIFWWHYDNWKSYFSHSSGDLFILLARSLHWTNLPLNVIVLTKRAQLYVVLVMYQSAAFIALVYPWWEVITWVQTVQRPILIGIRPEYCYLVGPGLRALSSQGCPTVALCGRGVRQSQRPRCLRQDKPFNHCYQNFRRAWPNDSVRCLTLHF